MIGYSEEEHGYILCAEKMPSLGYLEIDMLAKALAEYADRPNDVYDFVEKMMNAYTGEEELEEAN
jgi:hypothetical protein